MRVRYFFVITSLFHAKCSILMDFSRGIAPHLLLDQVRNTIPFALPLEAPQAPAVYLTELRSLAHHPKLHPELSHFEYFKLCVCAHFSTVSSFVPTDVDNQIRFKLWNPELPLQETEAMAKLVQDALHWDMTAISRRFVRSPRSGEVLSGMHGEWFSIAAGAYGALRKKNTSLALEIQNLITSEMEREARILEDLFLAKDGIGLLAAATTIAHNLGDLDRVMDQWNLAPDDSLRLQAYKAGHENDSRFRGLLTLAGVLNKTPLSPTSMADENHRHFALRAAKCLRRSPDFLLPISPFFDDWGAIIGRHPALSPEEVAQVTLCLMEGWEKLKPIQKTQAYPRALAGIESTFSGGLSRLCQYLPARAAKNLRSGPLRTACSVARKRFEENWSEAALKIALKHRPT